VVPGGSVLLEPHAGRWQELDLVALPRWDWVQAIRLPICSLLLLDSWPLLRSQGHLWSSKPSPASLASQSFSVTPFPLQHPAPCVLVLTRHTCAIPSWSLEESSWRDAGRRPVSPVGKEFYLSRGRSGLCQASERWSLSCLAVLLVRVGVAMPARHCVIWGGPWIKGLSVNLD
jgi:hypothetical protein